MVSHHFKLGHLFRPKIILLVGTIGPSLFRTLWPKQPRGRSAERTMRALWSLKVNTYSSIYLLRLHLLGPLIQSMKLKPILKGNFIISNPLM